MKEYNERFYRTWVADIGLNSFVIKYKESDLLILADKNLEEESLSNLKSLRHELEEYIKEDDKFLRTLSHHTINKNAPTIAKTMSSASRIYNIGPMAAVAGAFSEAIGKSLLKYCNTVIVENGGDIFAKADKNLKFSLYAGEDSPFSNKVIFELDARDGIGVCTSSGVVGPSLSFGNSDAVVAISENTALADAAATAIANRIKSPEDVDRVVNEEAEKNILKGLIACLGSKIAFWGDIKII